MDIQDVSNHAHGGTTITPVKHKSDETSHNDNKKHDTTNDKKNPHEKVAHTKGKVKLDLSAGIDMEGGFLASLDEVIGNIQPVVAPQEDTNYQNNDKLASNDDQTDNNINQNDEKNQSNQPNKLDDNENNNKKKSDNKKSDKNDKANNKIETKIVNTLSNKKSKSAVKHVDLNKVKDQIDTHHNHKTEKTATDDTTLKSLKEVQQEGIASKLEKGQHVKVEVKKTHQNKNQGQSFQVKIAGNQKLSKNEDHTKLHQKIVEHNEEKVGTVASANLSSNTNTDINNLVGGGVSNTGLKNSTIGKVSADAVTSVKGASSKSTTGSNNLLGSLNSQKTAQGNNTKPRPVQQPRPARKHVHIASTMSKINVDIAKAVDGGADRININLRPNNMGRIDVQIDMQQKGAVVIVNVEKQETLDMLQADASSLQQALENTGMELQGEMQFNLQENTSGGYDQGQGQQQQQPEEDENSLVANGVPTLEALQEVRTANAESRGGVDLVL